MTAKEKLRETVDDLSEAEAQDALGFIVRRRGQRDALGELLEGAPLDDEPTTPEEGESAREARAEIARGEVLSESRGPQGEGGSRISKAGRPLPALVGTSCAPTTPRAIPH
jgi:hypothetical protein